jgi:drug/metabolite transporter (DMT)-like permease
MYQHATKIGAIALLLWSFGPLFNSIVAAVPVFEILSFSFGIGFVVGSFYISLTHGWKKFNQSLKYWLIGFAGVFGNELLFVASFKYAPASHIILLSFLWPLVVVTLVGFFRQQRFSYRYFFAAMIGFSSVVFFLLMDLERIMLAKYWLGYILVLMATCCWSVYTLLNKSNQVMPSAGIAQYCGLGFIISLSLHLSTETFYLPSLTEMFGLVWLGLMGLCLAFNLWDFGVKYGDIRALSVLSYNNVLLSTLLLMAFSQVQYQASFIIAALGVMVASLVTLVEYDDVKRLLTKKTLPRVVLPYRSN